MSIQARSQPQKSEGAPVRSKGHQSQNSRGGVGEVLGIRGGVVGEVLGIRGGVVDEVLAIPARGHSAGAFSGGGDSTGGI